MAKLFAFIVLLISIISQPADAHEVLLDSNCRQGSCTRTLIRSIEPILFLKFGIVRRYEASYVEHRCDPSDEDVRKCSLIRPPFDKFESFSHNFAFCSLTNPTVITSRTTPGLPNAYIVRALDVTGSMANYATSSILEYLVVCHGWEPKAFDDSSAKSISALGYRSLTVVPPDKILTSEAEVLAFLTSGEFASPTTKPFYVGRWHIDNRRLCRGKSGQTEGLLTYTEREFIGLENWCQIAKATPQANRIELQLKCNGEGMASSTREVVQLLRNGRLSRTTFDGNFPQTFDYAKCPD